MLVYRPNEVSNTWWHKAGGFNITYPNYSHYINSDKMYSAIKEQNNNMLKFAHKHNATWNYFTTEWIKKMFKLNIKVDTIYDDILVSIIK
jgi:hypothetical protein